MKYAVELIIKFGEKIIGRNQRCRDLRWYSIPSSDKAKPWDVGQPARKPANASNQNTRLCLDRSSGIVYMPVKKTKNSKLKTHRQAKLFSKLCSLSLKGAGGSKEKYFARAVSTIQSL